MSVVLRARGLRRSVGGVAVLAGVDVDLAAGQVTVLVGPNGSGKTTLLRALLGHAEASGEIAWLGTPLANWSRRRLAQTVAYLPQAPTFEPGDRAIDVLRLGRLPYAGWLGLDAAADDAVVDQVAGELALTGLLARPMETLSGGQRQRVFLGRALVQRPKALLLDEPATYLDLRHQVELYALVRRIAAPGVGGGVAVLMASHDVNLSLAHADRAVVLKAGGVLAAGPAADVLTAATLTDAFDVPVRAVRDGATTLFVPDASARAV